MTIRLQVQWPNADHPLLQGVSVDMTIDGSPNLPISATPGKILFDIDEGSSHVLLKVKFEPTLPIPDLETVPIEVLSADQAWNVEGNTLRPDPTPFHLEDGEIILQNVHPLIDTISAGNAASGVTIAEVRTEYVDSTDIWGLVANGYFLSEYTADKEPGINLVSIAATGKRGPPLWFANFPTGLMPPTPEVGTFIFFRPTMQYDYSTAWDKRHGGDWGQSLLNRYMLAGGDPNVPVIRWYTSLMDRPGGAMWLIRDAYALRCSMQSAMLKSGRPIVALHPWPTGGTNFGDAMNANLPEALRGILRMLRGLGYVGINHPAIVPGRVGIGGFSAGGRPVFASLLANRTLVKELYLWDPMGLAAVAPFIIQWARHTPDFRLHMTGLNAYASMMGIYNAVRAGVSGEAGDLFLSAQPQDQRFWNPVDKGGSPYWNFVIQEHPEMQHDWSVMHQFMMFGGSEIQVNEANKIDNNVTWFEKFLNASGF